MASVNPISSAVNAPATPPLVLPPRTDTEVATAVAQNAVATAANATQAAAARAAATATTTQPLDLVFDSLALDSAFDETLFTSTAVEGTGAYSVFIGELFAALAAQQTQATQTAEQANAATTAATATATAAQPTAATTPPAAAATAEFASNAPSLTPNSLLESNVQALANQVQSANSGTSASTTAAAATLSPLQQSFEQFIESAGAAANANSLPTFLQTLANNLHSVPSPLGNLVDSVT
jgi:hypothetical protein